MCLCENVNVKQGNNIYLISIKYGCKYTLKSVVPVGCGQQGVVGEALYFLGVGEVDVHFPRGPQIP